MGTARNQSLLHGIVVHDETITPSAITEKDDTTVLLRSAYTQAGPRAGIAKPTSDYQMAIKASGTADEDASIQLLTHKGGHPVPEDGGYVWRNLADGDTATQYKGADSVVSVTDWQKVVQVSDAVNTPALDIVRLQSGDLIAVGIEVGAAAGTARAYKYTVSTGAWTNLGDPGFSVNSSTRYAICQLPSGRVLIYWISEDARQVNAQYSDDDGVTWADYAARVLGTQLQDSGASTVVCTRIAVGYSNGQMLFIASFPDASHSGHENLAQYASIDEGHTFALVNGDFWHATDNYPAAEPRIIAAPAGGFIVACYIRNNTFAILRYGAIVYMLGTAYTPLDEADSTFAWSTLDDPAVLAMTAWLDEDNILYVMSMDAGFVNPNTQYFIQLYRSLDFGATITPYNCATLNWNVLTNYLYGFAGTSTGGKAIIVTRWNAVTSSTYDTTSVAALCLGGFSSQTLPTSIAVSGSYFDEINSLGWAPATTGAPANNFGEMYVPIELPNNSMNWTATVSTGTSTISANAQLSIVTTGVQQQYYTISKTSATVTQAMTQFALEVDSPNGDKTTNEISVRLTLSDNAGATYGYDVNIQLEHDGYRVYDNEAGAIVGGAITVDLTSRRWFRVAMDKGNIIVWTAPDGHVHNWTKDVDGALQSAVGASGYENLVQFGHITGAANTSLWSNVAYSYNPWKWSDNDPSTFAASWTNPTSVRPKSYSSQRTLIDDGIFVAAEGGPTTLGETWQIDAEYEYPLAAIHPTIDTSPGRKWRSTGVGADVNIVWNTESLYADDGITGNNIIAVMLLGANFKDALFQVWTGAAWTTLATLDAADGYGPLKYARHGRKAVPNTAEDTTGKRYLWYEDHVGDTFNLGTPPGGDPPGQQYAKIVHNTEGAWIGSASTTKRPVIVLDNTDLDGGEAATNTGYIWRQNFGAVISGFTDTYSKYRLRIPAQSTADGYFTLGQVIIGPVAVLGMQYDRGYAFTHLHPLTAETMTDGTQRVRKDGPEQRRFTFSLTTGAVDLTSCNLDSPTPDYRTAEQGNALPVATLFDTSRTIEGIIRQQHAATNPVLILTAINRDTTGGSGIKVDLQNQRRAILWARLQTDPFVEAILGNETKTEMERYQLITAEEVV